jgi:DHA1 family tetracycline resistance protein-like MFS transporter
MKNRNVLIVVFLTIFVDLLGFGILIPIIPQLLANPFSEFYVLPEGFTIEQGYILLGFLVGIFPLMQFLSTPILGQLSDRYGRKKLLAFSLAGTSLSYVLFALGIVTRNLPLLFFARAFDGITGGNISVAQAAIADVTEPKDRARNFGLIGAAFGLGFIVGPYLGGKLGDPTVVSWFNAATPFWFAAILAALNTLSVILYFPETIKHYSFGAIHWAQSLINIGKAFALKGLRTVYISSFLFQAGFTFYTTFFSVYLINKFGFSQGNIGDFFAYVGLWIAITQAVITRIVTKVLREDQILRITFFGAAFFVLDYFVPQTPQGLLWIAPGLAIFIGLSMANIPALVSRSVDQKVQGQILGINASVQALAQAIPPMLSGFIAARLSPSAPIVVASLIMILGGIVFNLFYRPRSYVTAQA